MTDTVLTLAWFVLNTAFYVLVVRVAYARGRARERRETPASLHAYYQWKNGRYTP
jgi:hypothetical protein